VQLEGDPKVVGHLMLAGPQPGAPKELDCAGSTDAVETSQDAKRIIIRLKLIPHLSKEFVANDATFQTRTALLLVNAYLCMATLEDTPG